MKKINLIIMFGILILIGIAIAGDVYNSRIDNTIDINKTQQNILDARDLSNPTISELICDGEDCRSCAKKGDYGMGCIEISQTYCSEYNLTIVNNKTNETDGSCLAISDYTLNELEINEKQAYKIIWENIADVIIERENKVYEVKFEEEEINIIEKK